MALLCEEISLCSGEMQHNSSLGEAYFGRFKVSRFSGLFVKMLPGSAQEVKQAYHPIRWERWRRWWRPFDWLKLITHLWPITGDSVKLLIYFFALIKLTFYRCFHRKASETNGSARLICSCLQSVLLHRLWRSPMWLIRFVPNVGRTSENYCRPDFRRLKYVLGCSKNRFLLNETGFKGWLHAFGITGGLMFTDLWF